MGIPALPSWRNTPLSLAGIYKVGLCPHCLQTLRYSEHLCYASFCSCALTLRRSDATTTLLSCTWNAQKALHVTRALLQKYAEKAECAWGGFPEQHFHPFCHKILGMCHTHLKLWKKKKKRNGRERSFVRFRLPGGWSEHARDLVGPSCWTTCFSPWNMQTRLLTGPETKPSAFPSRSAAPLKPS